MENLFSVDDEDFNFSDDEAFFNLTAMNPTTNRGSNANSNGSRSAANDANRFDDNTVADLFQDGNHQSNQSVVKNQQKQPPDLFATKTTKKQVNNNFDFFQDTNFDDDDIFSQALDEVNVGKIKNKQNNSNKNNNNNNNTKQNFMRDTSMRSHQNESKSKTPTAACTTPLLTRKFLNNFNPTPFEGSSPQVPCCSKTKQHITPTQNGTLNSVSRRNLDSAKNVRTSLKLFQDPSKTPRSSVRKMSEITPLRSNNCLEQQNGLSNKRTVLKRKSLECTRKTPLKIAKFPGPAGRLPQLKTPKELENLKSPDAVIRRLLTPKQKTPEQLSNSQEDFSLNIYEDCLMELDKLLPGCQPQKIAHVIRDATANSLENGKVKVLCALVKQFTVSGTNGRLVLHDPTGQINATTHKLVLEEFEPDLREGTGLILRDASVYSPTLKRHYVNITPANVVSVLPADLNATLAQTQLTQLMEKENKQTKRSESVVDFFDEDILVGNI